MRMTKLSDFAYFISTKIDVKKLTCSNYISVDNMLQNKNGITQSEYLPDNGYAIAFKKNDILIGNIRPYLKKIRLASFDGGCSQDVLCLRCYNSCLSGFVFSLLSHDCFFDYVMKGSKGTRMARGDKNHILNYKFCDVSNKKQIGQLITNLNKKIFLNNQINDNLSQQLQLLFDFWFKQYNFANSIGKPYALSNGSFIYNDKLKRKIPENWIIGSLMNNPLSKPIEPGVSYFNCKNYLATANINRTAITDGENVAFENRESRANMEPRLYSIWFAKMKNSIKHLFISGKGQDIVEKYILSTGFAGINCDEKTFAYMAGVISDPTFELVKDKYAHGATQQSVNNDDLDLYKIVIPDSKTLEKYAALANPLYEKLNLLQIENNKLQKLRDYLLPLLLNGQVTIR